MLVEFLALYAYLVIGLCSGHSGSDEDDEEMDVMLPRRLVKLPRH